MSVNFTDNSPEILAELERKTKQALYAIGSFVEGEAKLNTPVDTGNLRNSITHEEDSDSTTIGSAVEYAVYVHEGARGRGGTPFLRDAVTQNESQIKQLAEQILKG